MHRGLHLRGALIGNRRASCGRYTTKFLWRSGLFQLAQDFSIVSRLFIQAWRGYRERTIVSCTRLQIGESCGSGWLAGLRCKKKSSGVRSATLKSYPILIHVFSIYIEIVLGVLIRILAICRRMCPSMERYRFLRSSVAAGEKTLATRTYHEHFLLDRVRTYGESRGRSKNDNLERLKQAKVRL